MFGLSERDWQFVNFMVRLGVYTTIVSIPIGVLAMRKWPNIPLVPVFLISTTATPRSFETLSSVPRTQSSCFNILKHGNFYVAGPNGAIQGSIPLRRTGSGMSYEFSRTGLGVLLAPSKLPPPPISPMITTKIAAPTGMFDRPVSLPMTTATLTTPALVQPTIEKIATNLAFSEAAKVVAAIPTLTPVRTQTPVITRITPVVVSPVQVPVRAPSPEAVLPVAPIPTPVLVKVPVLTRVVQPSLTPVRVSSPAPVLAPRPVLPIQDYVLQQATANAAAEAARIKEQEASAALAKSMAEEAQRLKDESYKASQQVDYLQANARDMQAKIDELNRQLYSQIQTPQSAVVIQDQLQVLTEDLAVTESQIPAAEAQAEATEVAAQDLMTQATEIDASVGQSWFSKNRTLVFVLGVAAVGVWYWHYKKNKSQLPPPELAEAPSGLSRNRR